MDSGNILTGVVAIAAGVALGQIVKSVVLAYLSVLVQKRSQKRYQNELQAQYDDIMAALKESGLGGEDESSDKSSSEKDDPGIGTYA